VAVVFCQTEQAVARGAKEAVDGRGAPLSRLTAPALPKGEPTKDMLIIKASPFGRGAEERGGEGKSERTEGRKLSTKLTGGQNNNLFV